MNALTGRPGTRLAEIVLQGLLVACMMDADRLRTDARQEGEEQGDPMGEDGQPLPPQDGLSQHLLCKAYFDERASQCAPSLDVEHIVCCLSHSHSRAGLARQWRCRGLQVSVQQCWAGCACASHAQQLEHGVPVCLVLQATLSVLRMCRRLQVHLLWQPQMRWGEPGQG